jgi:hypothetical protein
MGIHSLNRHAYLKLRKLAGMGSQTRFGFVELCAFSTQPLKIKYRTTWLKSCYRLSQILVMLLHMTGGPGSRMTEEAAWLVSNSSYSSAKRNVRFALGQVCVVNTYSKSQKLKSGRLDDVASFACDELSLLTLFFLIVVKPLEVQYCDGLKVSNPNAKESSTCYFIVKNGVPIKGVLLGYMFSKELHHYGINLSISGFRQALDAFARTCPGVSEPWKDSLTNTLGLNANHSHLVHVSTYGRSTADLPGFDADRVFLFKKCSEVWNDVILGRTNPFDPIKKPRLVALTAKRNR